MKEILLCSHNPILQKDLHGLLRDEGYSVEITDHPANAVRIVMSKPFTAVIIDSKGFGLSAEDAVQIIKTISPEIRVILMGYPELETDAFCIKAPMDLEIIKKLVHDIHSFTTIS